MDVVSASLPASAVPAARRTVARASWAWLALAAAIAWPAAFPAACEAGGSTLGRMKGFVTKTLTRDGTADLFGLVAGFRPLVALSVAVSTSPAVARGIMSRRRSRWWLEAAVRVAAICALFWLCYYGLLLVAPG